MTTCNRCGKTNPADVHTCTPRAGTYILDGKTPVFEPDLHKWGEWFETANRQTVAVIESLNAVLPADVTKKEGTL